LFKLSLKVMLRVVLTRGIKSSWAAIVLQHQFKPASGVFIPGAGRVPLQTGFPLR